MRCLKLIVVQLVTSFSTKLESGASLGCLLGSHQTRLSEKCLSMEGTFFDKLDFFSTPYTKEQQLLKNLAVFEFESICVREEQFKDTEATQWVGKHVPISVSISSTLIETPIFFLQFEPSRFG